MEMALPSLSTKTPRYPHVPKRYEETRPVVVQDFTHRRILGFGHQIHRKQLEQIEQEKLEAIRLAEEAVWREAEGLKESTIEKVRKQARLEQEKIIRKMLKEMDKKLKEEGLKVEMTMQKLALEQVKEERLKGDSAMKEAVKQTEDKMKAEKLSAIAAVRTEERKVAEASVAKLRRKHEQEIAKVKAEMDQKYKREMEAVVKEKDLDRKLAVHRVQQEEQKTAAERLQTVQSQFEREIRDLKAKINGKVLEIMDLEEKIKNTEKSKEKVKECLVETREAFQRSVAQMAGFSDDQASFLMPSLYLDQLQED